MIRYTCDWCKQDFALNEINNVKISNVYNQPVRLHICHKCGKEYLPKDILPMLSWTAIMDLSVIEE